MIPEHLAGKWHNRDRKTRYKRDRRLDAKTRSASYHLRGCNSGAHCFTAEITKHGLFSFLFQELKEQVIKVLDTRRKIHAARRQAARRMIEEASSMVIERYTKHGAQLVFGEEVLFKIPIREEDCLRIDDWQWVMSSTEDDQKVIFLVTDIYTGIARWQVENLLEKNQVSYHSRSKGWLKLRRSGPELLTPLAMTMPVELQIELAALAA